MAELDQTADHFHRNPIELVRELLKMPNVTLKFKDNVVGRYLINKGKSLTIGRRKDNDIVIENLAVSGHHAKIDSVGDGFVLVDLQSKNGSFVNERLVNSQWLKNGDVVSIGKHFLVFSTEDGASAVANGVPAEIDRTMVMDTSNYRSMVKKSAPMLPKPLMRHDAAAGHLDYLAGGEGRIDLSGKLIKIGKAPTSEIVVKGFWVGWTAATVSRRPDGYYLSYAGGFSKPRVNDRPVKTSIMLRDLDVIAIGSVTLQFFTQTLDDARTPQAASEGAGGASV
jgi:pSer/pThr/pTyr-binding forkhead associated (FHA) protein